MPSAAGPALSRAGFDVAMFQVDTPADTLGGENTVTVLELERLGGTLELRDRPEPGPAQEYVEEFDRGGDGGGGGGWRGTPQFPSTAPTHAPATSRHANSSASTLEPPERIARRTAATASPCRPSRSRSAR